MSCTLGSLFDGIGAFPLAASRNGIIPAWASEIEKWPISITARHFPGMEQLGDITQLHGGNIPPVDIITFGSPCQNLSQAGEIKGINGPKSRLFFEAVRIIREMKEATNGRFPTIALWENVTGAFISNSGMDYFTVLAELTEAQFPMPGSGRWARAGLVRGNGVDVAWRTLDAQYWGLPQHRERVFVVRDYRGERAERILFTPEDLPRDTREREKIRVQAAAGNGNPVEAASGAGAGLHAAPISARAAWLTLQCQNKGVFQRLFYREGDPAPTLLARHDKGHIVAFWHGIPPEISGGIRYFLPLEYERLMGFPDGWTAYGANGEPVPDRARYEALGNSVAVPCAEYLMHNIKRELGG